MKWKCDACTFGPCVYECSYYAKGPAAEVDRCPRHAAFGPSWKSMSTSEPERKDDSGLPEWLRVGNFVWLDAGLMSIKNPEYQGVPRGIYKIISIKSDSLRIESIHDRCNGYFKIPWGDADEIQRLSMRPVYPKPYTFETAPIIFKARRKVDGSRVVLAVDVHNNSFTGFGGIGEHGTIFISFEDALRDYERLDGWPCGTFDGEDENNNRKGPERCW